MATQKKSPLQRVRDEFKTKEALVDRLLDVIEKADQQKDTLKTKLLAASNKKLLRLLEAAHEVKTRFGSTEKVAEAVAQAMGKAKDRDYVQKLAKYAPPRLIDLLHSVEKKSRSASSGA